ncbi:MAG: site-2 protease family protein [Clostridia bacterium]|nr:site-2 protease family protein [Clostridia bacterium]
MLALLCFSVLILLHEGGHFFFARRFGVPVKEFSIGMGPKLLQFKSKKHDTRYSIRLLPIGGYVSMVGEDEESEDENALSRKPVWQRMIITAAGSGMNILVGLLAMFILLMSSGQTLISTTVGAFDEGALSAQSGLMLEDKILRVDGMRVHTGNDLVYAVAHDGYQPVRIEVLRGGEKIVLENVVFPTVSEAGITYGSPDFKLYALEKTFPRLLAHAWDRSVLTVRMVWDSLVDFALGRYSVEHVSGPIGATQQIGQAAEEGSFSFIYMITIISINLGIVNLLPLPALDGGRMLFLFIELFRRKPLPAQIEAYVHFAGIVVLLAFMLFISFKDVIKLFG